MSERGAFRPFRKFAPELRPYLRAVAQAPVAIAMLGALQMIVLFTGRLPLLPQGLIQVGLVGVACLGRLFLVRERLTVHEILRGIQLILWPLALATFTCGWTFAEIGHAVLLARYGVFGLGAAAVTAAALFMAYQLLPGSSLRQYYAQLAAYVGAGEIDASDLYEIVSFGSAAQRVAKYRGFLMAIVVSGPGVARIFYGMDGALLGGAYVMFVCGSYFSGSLIARLILQPRYIGSNVIKVRA